MRRTRPLYVGYRRPAEEGGGGVFEGARRFYRRVFNLVCLIIWETLSIEIMYVYYLTNVVKLSSCQFVKYYFTRNI